MEDLYLAEQRTVALKEGRSRTYTLDEVKQRLGPLIAFEKEAEEDLKKLDREAGRRILTVLRRIAGLDDPRSVGAALAGSKLGHYWKCRAGDCRIIADIQNTLIMRLGNRRELSVNRCLCRRGCQAISGGSHVG